MSLSRCLSEADIACGRYAANILRKITSPDNAKELHKKVCGALARRGFLIWNEFPTANLGDTRDGRIDLVVELDGGAAAIELDTRKPRRRSLQKLRLFYGYMIVGLRGVSMISAPHGIDEVVKIEVSI